MKKLLGTLAGLVLLAGAYVLAPIEEDEPGWNCAIHGNHICNTTNILGYNY